MDYSKGSEKKTVFIFFVFYFIINMFFLDSFPFVHADEAWLASLSRAMMKEKSIDAVEDFFHLNRKTSSCIENSFSFDSDPLYKNIFFNSICKNYISSFCSYQSLFFL